MAVKTDDCCNGLCLAGFGYSGWLLWRVAVTADGCLQRMAVTTGGVYSGWFYNGWLLQRMPVKTDGGYDGWLPQRMMFIAGGCYNGIWL
jgi:hypothetical protein